MSRVLDVLCSGCLGVSTSGGFGVWMPWCLERAAGTRHTRVGWLPSGGAPAENVGVSRAQSWCTSFKFQPAGEVRCPPPPSILPGWVVPRGSSRQAEGNKWLSWFNSRTRRERGGPSSGRRLVLGLGLWLGVWSFFCCWISGGHRLLNLAKTTREAVRPSGEWSAPQGAGRPRRILPSSEPGACDTSSALGQPMGRDEGSPVPCPGEIARSPVAVLGRGLSALIVRPVSRFLSIFVGGLWYSPALRRNSRPLALVFQ